MLFCLVIFFCTLTWKFSKKKQHWQRNSLYIVNKEFSNNCKCLWVIQNGRSKNSDLHIFLEINTATSSVTLVSEDPALTMLLTIFIHWAESRYIFVSSNLALKTCNEFFVSLLIILTIFPCIASFHLDVFHIWKKKTLANTFFLHFLLEEANILHSIQNLNSYLKGYKEN